MARKRRSTSRKLFDHLFAGLVLVLIGLAIAFFTSMTGQEYAGQLKVVDGDTLLSGEQKLRLEGIDAPEWTQKCRKDGREWNCGREAVRYLRLLIRGGRVVCKSSGVDKYARPLVRCKAGDIDINSRMVEEGWAISYGDYFSQEASAKRNKLGIWAGEFEKPQVWREIHRGSAESNGIFTHWLEAVRSWLLAWTT